MIKLTPLVIAATVAVAPLFVAGCAAHVYGEPVADAYVYQDEPVGIYAAPRVYYDDTWVYYSGGHWYRQTPRGWAYYRREPEVLRQRPYVQEAPRARRYEAPHVTSAPVVREAPRAR
jgi:hypothetical protein